MTLRDEILEQPAVAAAFLGRSEAPLRSARGGHHCAGGRPRRHRRAWHDRPRRDLRPVRARDPARTLGGPRDAVGHVPLRRRAPPGPGAGHRHQPVRGVAGRRRRRRGGPPTGRTDPRHHQRPDVGLADRRRDVIDLGAGPERAIAATKTYTTELLAVAAAVGRVERSRGGRCGARGRSRTRSREHCPSSPRHRAIARDQAGADRCLVIGRGYEYADRARVGAQAQGARPRRRRSVLGGRLPARAAGAHRGRASRCSSIVRPGPARDGLVRSLTRLRDDLDAELVIVSDDAEALALARWPFAAAARARPSGWVPSSRSSSGSCTPCI